MANSFTAFDVLLHVASAVVLKTEVKKVKKRQVLI